MNKIGKAKFITFEGGEGSGKSTQSKKLYKYLLSQDIKVIHTREIGGTPEAEKIRDLLVYNSLYPISELMLVMAARYEHINKVIVPALQENCWVICDRFIDSTACYQSGDDLTMEDIFKLHYKLMRSSGDQKAIMPDITFFMDLLPEEGLKRSLATLDVNKFEAKDMEFHQQIYEKFKALGSMYQDRIKAVNCLGKGESEIGEEIRNVVGKLVYV